MESDSQAAPTLGDIIRKQRELAEIPMRHVAAMVGISTPYLSQIERGLRAPSEQVLQGIADSLQTTVDALDAAASPRASHEKTFAEVLRGDPNLTAKQRSALIEVHRSMSEATIAQRGRRRS